MKHYLRFFLALVCILLAGCNAATATSVIKTNPTSTQSQTIVTIPADTPTQTLTVTVDSATQWKTTDSWDDIVGNLKTTPFTANNPWNIVWSCVPNSWGTGDFNFIVNVNTLDGHFYDGGPNEICSPGDDSGSYV